MRQYINFYNVKSGISDMSVFDVPDGCSSGFGGGGFGGGSGGGFGGGFGDFVSREYCDFSLFFHVTK